MTRSPVVNPRSTASHAAAVLRGHDGGQRWPVWFLRWQEDPPGMPMLVCGSCWERCKQVGSTVVIFDGSRPLYLKCRTCQTITSIHGRCPLCNDGGARYRGRGCMVCGKVRGR
jgi:hypothetical protein